MLGATTKVAALKKALSAAKAKETTERTEPEKQDAWVGEVQQELQELGKKFESVEHELKAKEAELAKALASIKDARPKPRSHNRKSRRPKR